MRQRVGKDLPTFSEKDREFIRNKIDFIGINHYTSRFIAHHPSPGDISFYQVQQVERIGTMLQFLRNIFLFQQMMQKSRIISERERDRADLSLSTVGISIFKEREGTAASYPTRGF
jgi:beta-glucosidase/6-phospho-beta-glucosidase/beta-galactosidase